MNILAPLTAVMIGVMTSNTAIGGEVANRPRAMSRDKAAASMQVRC